MKQCPSISLCLTSLLFIFMTAGCQTGGINTVKSRGVYTVLCPSEPSLDLPATGYQPRVSFSPNEVPAAIIVGYGDYNRPKLVALDVIELRTGQSVFGHDYYAAYGKVVVQPLPMRISGSYRVRLIVNGSEYDSCEFTVGAGTSLPATTSLPPGYVKARFSVGLGVPVMETVAAQTADAKPIFAKYDERLAFEISAALFKEVGEASPNPLTQRAPGRTLIQCHLNASGHLTNSSVLENTLGNECRQVILQALLKHSPYSPWPEDLRQKFGSDTRTLIVAIGFE